MIRRTAVTVSCCAIVAGTTMLLWRLPAEPRAFRGHFEEIQNMEIQATKTLAEVSEEFATAEAIDVHVWCRGAGSPLANATVSLAFDWEEEGVDGVRVQTSVDGRASIAVRSFARLIGHPARIGVTDVTGHRAFSGVVFVAPMLGLEVATRHDLAGRIDLPAGVRVREVSLYAPSTASVRMPQLLRKFKVDERGCFAGVAYADLERNVAFSFHAESATSQVTVRGLTAWNDANVVIAPAWSNVNVEGADDGDIVSLEASFEGDAWEASSQTRAIRNAELLVPGREWRSATMEVSKRGGVARAALTSGVRTARVPNVIGSPAKIRGCVRAACGTPIPQAVVAYTVARTIAKARTAEDGTYMLEVPYVAETARLSVWHEMCAPAVIRTTIRAGEERHVDVTMEPAGILRIGMAGVSFATTYRDGPIEYLVVNAETGRAVVAHARSELILRSLAPGRYVAFSAAPKNGLFGVAMCEVIAGARTAVQVVCIDNPAFSGAVERAGGHEPLARANTVLPDIVRHVWRTSPTASHNE